jgi:hypothetical protein
VWGGGGKLRRLGIVERCTFSAFSLLKSISE